MIDLLAIGTFWFWTTLVVSFIILELCIGYEKYFGATSTLIITGALLFFLGAQPLFYGLIENPMLLVFYFLIYSVMGTIYATFDWWLYCRDTKRDFESYIENNKPSHQAQYKDNYDKFVEETKEGYRPKVRYCKAMVVGNIVYWPFDLLFNLLGRYVIRFFNTIFDSISGLLNRISVNTFK